MNTEWDGVGVFKGGSISTLFVNGASTKQWLNKDWLFKSGSNNEKEVFDLCVALGLSVPETKANDKGFYIKNFTSPDFFLETFEQSGMASDDGNTREEAYKFLGNDLLKLFTIDYLVEHDDRHWGNYGWLRNADNGEFVGMTPWYDFDLAWSDNSIELPAITADVLELAEKALRVCNNFEHGNIIEKRARELLRMEAKNG